MKKIVVLLFILFFGGLTVKAQSSWALDYYTPKGFGEEATYKGTHYLFSKDKFVAGAVRSDVKLVIFGNGYKNGTSIPRNRSLNELTPIPYQNPYKEKLAEISKKHMKQYIDNNFKKEQFATKSSQNEHSSPDETKLLISLFISPETGKIVDIKMHFFLARNQIDKVETPDISFFYNLEKEIRDANMTFKITEEGKKRTYCLYYCGSNYNHKTGTYVSAGFDHNKK